MATATAVIDKAAAPPMRNGVKDMNNNQSLSPNLEKVVDDILGLRELAATTGYMTFKEQRAILDKLTSADKAAVGRELAKRERIEVAKQ